MDFPWYFRPVQISFPGFLIPRLALDFCVLLDFPSGTFALSDCSLVLTPACVLDLSSCPIKHLPLELYLESAHDSSVPDSDKI